MELKLKLAATGAGSERRLRLQSNTPALSGSEQLWLRNLAIFRYLYRIFYSISVDIQLLVLCTDKIIMFGGYVGYIDRSTQTHGLMVLHSEQNFLKP